MPYYPPSNNTQTGNGSDLYALSGSGGGGGGGVTSVVGTANQITSSGTSAITLALASPSPAPTAGSYVNPSSVTVDALGRVTAITAGSTPVDLLGKGYPINFKNLSANTSFTALNTWTGPLVNVGTNLSSFPSIPNRFAGSIVNWQITLSGAPTVTGAVAGVTPTFSVVISDSPTYGTGQNLWAATWAVPASFVPNQVNSVMQLSPTIAIGNCAYQDTQVPSTNNPSFYAYFLCFGATSIVVPGKFYCEMLANCVAQYS